jgi:hypothetical protein
VPEPNRAHPGDGAGGMCQSSAKGVRPLSTFSLVEQRAILALFRLQQSRPGEVDPLAGSEVVELVPAAAELNDAEGRESDQ